MNARDFACSLLLLTSMVRWCHGHGDPIVVTISNDALATNGNVFSTEFEPVGSLTFTDVPGFEFPGFEPGVEIGFDVVDHLWYWSATGGLMPPPQDDPLRIEGKDAPFPVVEVSHDPTHVDGENRFKPGFVFETIDALSPQHQHLLAYLFESEEIATGAYGIVMQLKADGLDASAPFLIAFNKGLGGVTFRDAILELRDAAFSVPEPFPPGDFNHDRLVDALDIDLLYEHRGTNELATFDLTTDGRIDGADAAVWVEQIVGTRFGDVNLDRSLDLSDLNNIRNHFGGAGGWAAGDTDGSGAVDLGDLNNVRNHFGFAGTPAPEPAALLTSLVACTVVAMARAVGNHAKVK